MSTDRVEKKYAPEILMRATRPITLATAKAVAAGNSCRQEDVIAAANMGRKAISDLLRASKVITSTQPLKSNGGKKNYFKELPNVFIHILMRYG